MGVADAEVQATWRPNIARGQDAHPREVARRLRATSEEVGLGIAESRDPVRAAKPGEMRVAIDETRDDGRPGRVDELGAARVRGAVVGSDVRDPAVAHEHRYPAPERRRAAVRERGAAKEDGRRRYLLFLPMVRMKVSMGMADSVSIWTVPRAPSPTETREIVSLSFASTMLTKS